MSELLNLQQLLDSLRTRTATTESQSGMEHASRVELVAIGDSLTIGNGSLAPTSSKVIDR